MKKNTDFIKCYICKSSLVELHKQVNDFPIYKCKKCHLLWTQNITEKDIELFYDENYFYSDSKIGYSDYLASEKTHRKNAKNILKIVDKVHNLTDLKILDIGCAHGFLLDEARKWRNCSAFGIELSKFARNYAKNILNLAAYKNGIEDRFESNFFDVIFLVGTIEHLIDPKETLENIYRILKPKGLLIITTIDTKGMIRLYSLKPPEHLFYFNHQNIKKLLDKFNYKIVLRKTHYNYYYMYDLFHRFAHFSSIFFLDSISGKLKKMFPNLSVKIPTNEMIVIAQKNE